MRASSRLALLTASVLVCAGVAVVGGRVGAPAAAESVIGAGETVLVSPASLAPTDDPSGFGAATFAPVLSGDGLRAAYGSRAGCCGQDVIHVHDLPSGRDTALADPAQDRRAPSISEDGHLVSFQADDATAFDGARDVYVADLSGAQPAVRRVTGLAGATGDLPYQRQSFCNPGGLGDVESDPRCGPRLSADGTALVIPAFQSIQSPQLTAAPVESAAGTDVVDFGIGPGTQVITLTAHGHEPITIDSLRIEPDSSETPAAFSVAPQPELSDCTDGPELDPESDDAAGNSCAVVLRFTPPAGSCADDVSFGRLLVDSPQTGGQIELALIGRSEGCISLAAPTIEDSSCPQPMPVADASNAFPSDEPPPSDPILDRGLSEQVGQSVVVAQRIVNDNSEGSDFIRFQTADCAIRLVRPTTEDPDARPCETGTAIPPGQSCIAYVRFTPTDVRSYGAMLSTSDAQIRFFGAGTRSLLLLKRDPTATGAFVGPGENVSVDENGAEIIGSQPAISRNGRFVSFTVDNRDAAGRFLGQRVLVRDTSARRTTLGSVGVPATSNADESAISGDGRRIAYTTWADDRFEASHVQVRDRTLGRTVQVSDPTGGQPPTTEEAYNRTPALSLDGSTVSFVSNSAALVPAGVPPSQQVYVRDLGPDFGGPGTPQIELASPPVGPDPDVGQADAPALDATGASIAFLANGDVVADPPPLNSAVYARHRFGATAVAPTALSFAAQPVGSVGPTQAVTVRNDGPGPSTVDLTPAGPFVLTNGCASVVLHRAESCVFQVASAPTQEGPQSGRARVTTGNPVWDGTVTDVALSGESAPAIAQMLVQPETLAFGPQVIGTPSAPTAVTATNISTLPMAVTATLGAGATDYLLGADPACANLSPGASCRLSVRFKPSALGIRPGRLDISGAVGTAVIPRQIPITGTTATPTLTFSPTVVQEGRVTFLTGENFLPGVPALLQWSAGLTNVRQIVPDARGRFRTALVLLTGAPRGERILTVRMPTVGDVQSEPLLVVSRSAQPPDFERD